MSALRLLAFACLCRSRIAFDYLSRELVFGQRPFRVIGKLFSVTIKLYDGEAFHFGISTRPPARDPLPPVQPA
jgi:hypothetical protein